MPIISASILAADFAALGSDCSRALAAGADCLHFDVMDGNFVPNLSVGVPVLASLSKAVKTVYDVHLMIAKPLDYVEAFCNAGANWLTFHVEAESDVAATLAAIRARGVKAGLSLRPATPVEHLVPYLAQLDMVLVMSVEPGFGGQSFREEAPQRIAQIRAAAAAAGNPQLVINVDGGINAVTAPLCTAAGADWLVAGTAIFGAEDYAAAVRSLR